MGRLASIPIATRVGPRAFLLADLLVCLASLAAILAAPGSLAAAAGGTIGVGLGMASIFPTVLALAGQHMTLTGRVTGSFFFGSSLGGMVLPWLIGQRFEASGPRIAIWVVAAAITLALAVYGLLRLDTARR